MGFPPFLLPSTFSLLLPNRRRWGTTGSDRAVGLAGELVFPLFSVSLPLPVEEGEGENPSGLWCWPGNLFPPPPFLVTG